MTRTNEILFKERQKFKQWWLWLVLLSINGFFLFGVIYQVIGRQQFGNKPMSNTALLVMTSFLIVLTLFFVSFRLETTLKRDGIYVRFFPFHLKFRHYTWDTLTKSFIRQYAPFKEYGGWGLRIGLFGKGRAFTLSGNKGLQLEFANKKKLLIGTNKPFELSETLNKIGQLRQ